MSLKFGTDGVRGRALTELTPQFAAALGAAAAGVLGAGRWIIGHDGRESGPLLVRAFAGGLAGAGVAPELAGLAPTPVVAAAGARDRVVTAMVTASHNPWHDNGIKLFAPGGLKLSDAVEEQIEAALEAELASPRPLSADQPWPAADLTTGYLADLTAMFPARCLDRLTVALDCANGAFSEVAPAAVRALGATTHVIHDRPDGRNINDECGATHTAPLQQAVVQLGADLGLAFDGDGDRVIAVDHTGRVVDGDRLIAMAALQMKQHGELTGNTVVVTVMSNLGFHKAMAEAGIAVVTTAVGDRYVLEALDAGGYSVGGEQSGHIIYRDVATTGDGLLAGLHLAQFVAEHHEPLATVAANVMTSYPQVLVNVRVAHRHPAVASEMAAEVAMAEAGLGGDGRVLLRASGTEPLIRVMVEATTDELARSVAATLADEVRARFA